MPINPPRPPTTDGAAPMAKTGATPTWKRSGSGSGEEERLDTAGARWSEAPRARRRRPRAEAPPIKPALRTRERRELVIHGFLSDTLRRRSLNNSRTRRLRRSRSQNNVGTRRPSSVWRTSSGGKCRRSSLGRAPRPRAEIPGAWRRPTRGQRRGLARQARTTLGRFSGAGAGSRQNWTRRGATGPVPAPKGGRLWGRGPGGQEKGRSLWGQARGGELRRAEPRKSAAVHAPDRRRDDFPGRGPDLRAAEAEDPSVTWPASPSRPPLS